ncbi:MAG: cation-translocating P-type ATPase [Deltaproteobacteria bacterium]|nr:cation-translocating P-type ATPase [Deltaproteobacteria bacterium]
MSEPGQTPEFSRSPEDVLEARSVSAVAGLGPEQVSARRAQFGPNALPEPPGESALRRLARQLANPLVLTLLVSAGVALWVGSSQSGSVSFLGKYGNAIAIAFIVALNAILGFVQEGRAAAALDALKRMVTAHARVRRGGETRIVGADELVPGDVMVLEAGDAVPSDARLVESAELEVEESALTGESQPVPKDARAIVAADATLADRRTMVYLGTAVTRGRGVAVVVATGRETELGRIGAMLSQVRKESTPLEHRLEAFDKRILVICLAVSAGLFALGAIRGGQTWPQLLLQCVSLAVAIIPEGLPAITTITLGLGMQRMAERGAVVRRLPAVETLGTATVICTDKTGTLTENQMTVRRVWCADRELLVTGEGYEPRGTIVPRDGARGGPPDAVLSQLLTTGAICNTATLNRDPGSGAWATIGDPTEGALLSLACKGGVDPEPARHDATIVSDRPFDAARQRMTVVTRTGDGPETAHVKGGVDVVLPLCSSFRVDGGDRPLGSVERDAILGAAVQMSGDALRVLAIARREHADPADPEKDLVLLGLVGMMDPPRAGVADAVAACKRAGVRTVMITGDHPATAEAVAREIGILETGKEVWKGSDLDMMTSADLLRRIGDVAVFARTTPEQKLEIVRALKARGEIVAMTGDGVNDAPALREAHIGVAMGRAGTDVARQAADLVLTDDNFATLVEAIREGRAIYRNIQKFIFFLLSSNAGLGLTVLAVTMRPSWLTLTPLMILWINLVTNGLPALALGIDPADPRQMQEPPRRTTEPLLSTADYAGIAFVGVVMAAMATGMFALPPPGHVDHPEGHRALAFSVLALAPLFHAWSCRSPVASIVGRQVPLRALAAACLASALIHFASVMVPALRPVFLTFPLSWSDWGYLVLLSVGVVPAVELAKLLRRATSARHRGERVSS